MCQTLLKVSHSFIPKACLLLLAISGSKWIFTWKRLFRLESESRADGYMWITLLGKEYAPPSSSDWSVPEIRRLGPTMLHNAEALMINDRPKTRRDQWHLCCFYWTIRILPIQLEKITAKGWGTLKQRQMLHAQKLVFSKRKIFIIGLPSPKEKDPKIKERED